MGSTAPRKAIYVWDGFTKPGFLQEITIFVEKAGRSLGLNNHSLFRVQMAVGEACANSWEHSYHGKRGRLHLEMELKGKAVEVRLTDWGEPFVPKKVPTPKIGSRLRDVDLEGLGLLVMRRAVDKVRFSSDPRFGNKVIMRKKLGTGRKRRKKSISGRLS